MAAKRFSDEPAYVLHRYDWSESSLILEVFTRRQGRIALVARGAKKPSSNFRPVLLPLQRLHVAFGGDAEIRNLKSAEWQGGHVMPTGDALLSGYYLNELLMRLLARNARWECTGQALFSDAKGQVHDMLQISDDHMRRLRGNQAAEAAPAPLSDEPPLAPLPPLKPATPAN